MEAELTNPAGGRVYSRAAIDEYLEQAAAANEQLRALIEEAHARRVAAQRLAEQATALGARTALHDLHQELFERRSRVEREAEGIVLDAQSAAADVLRRARDDARELLLCHDMVVDLPDDVDIDLIALTAESDPAPVDGFAVAVHTGNGTSGNGASSNGSSGNGSHGNGASANGNGSKSSGLASLLRWNRPRDDELIDPADEAFLAFLRGALLDDEPLGPSLDHREG